jgi:trimeric autotransporter adhesin
MSIGRIANQRGNTFSRSFFSWPVVRIAGIFVLAGLAAGCGGGSSKDKATIVAQVLISPSTASLEAGDVLSLTASAVNSSNGAVSAPITFSSSNTKVATISPGGLVCGGVWDSTFVVCNGTDALGNPVSGTATVTATAQGVTSGPVTVAVHPSVTAVSVDPGPAAGCFSNSQTHQFKAHAFHNGVEITNLVGDFTWSVSDNTVAAIDANGLASAKLGGLTGVVASIGATTAPATSFRTCLPVDIILHIAGDPADKFTFSATMNTNDTKNVQVDTIDENGVATAAAPLPVFSNNIVVASIGGSTLTALSPGGAGLQAVCAPPSCGNGLNTPLYSNVFSVSVNGTSPNTTTVYAASFFPPPTGSIMPLVPIDISKSPPAVGAQIALPGVPNSIVFDRLGARAFLGTNAGLVSLDTASNLATLLTATPLGKVLAVSADGTKVIVSNGAKDPATGNPIEANTANQRVWVVNVSASTITAFVAPGAVAATFDEDGFRAYIVADNGNYYVFSPLQTFQTRTIGGGGPSTDATTLASGPFTYVANSAGLEVLSTCNGLQQPVASNPPTNSSTIQLVGAVKSADQIFVVDSTGVNVETVTVTAPTPPVSITAANCQPNVAYSNTFVDFGAGPFTARQLLVAPDGIHAAVLPAGINKIFTVVNGTTAGTAQLHAGATEALSGGMTPDGNGIWVGVAGTNSVDFINLRTNTDDIQVPVSFKHTDGSPAPAGLVAIKPK